METAGVVIGGVGLAALFETCMSCFDYIETGRRYGRDYQKFELAMCSLENRLSRWGKLARLQDNTIHITQKEDSHIRNRLGQIQADLEDAGRASKRYQPTLSSEDGSIRLQTLAERFRRQAHARQRRTPLSNVIKWALHDSKKCKRLIEDIKDGISDLGGVFSRIGPETQLARQAAVEDAQQLIQPAEVEEPAEPDAAPVIDILREVTDVDQVLQQVIEIVAKQASAGDEIRNVFTGGKARVALDDFIASDYAGPVPTERTRSRVMNNVITSDEARVIVGRSYGGKSVFDD